MGRITQPNGKDNVADHPLFKQLQADVTQIKKDMPDLQLKAVSSVTFIERTDKGLQALTKEMAALRADNEALREMVKTVIDTSNNILKAVRGES